MNTPAGNSNHIAMVIRQIDDPIFVRVILKSAVLALLALIPVVGFIDFIWPTIEGFFSAQQYDFLSGITGTASNILYYIVIALGIYILFPIIMSVMIGLFLEEIATAVEDRYYPQRKGPRIVGFIQGLFSGLVLTLKVMAIHLLFAIPYLILSIFTAGIGTLILFSMVNAWAYSQEYYSLVAGRHMTPRDVRLSYKKHKREIFFSGIVIAVLLLIPLINILVPLIGVALLTHRNQDILKQDHRR